ncbi:MAG: shikimate dehydrogenase [Acidimicrobiales bacterium]
MSEAAERVLGVIGYPARHSLSPVVQRAAYKALGLCWRYEVFEVPSRAFSQVVRGAGSDGLYGLSVTMPHKQAAAAIATRRSEVVETLSSANTLSFRGAEIVADSTDGQGLMDDLRQEGGFDPSGRCCGVIGAGGAARAVVLALFGAGAAEVLIVNRTESRAREAALLAPLVGRVARPEELSGCDLVVQATPLTMRAGSNDEMGLLGACRLGAGQLVVDLSYRPASNTFLETARLNGARTRNGLGMLVHQAARQVNIWSGRSPPTEAMWAALAAHIETTAASESDPTAGDP